MENIMGYVVGTTTDFRNNMKLTSEAMEEFLVWSRENSGGSVSDYERAMHFEVLEAYLNENDDEGE